MPNPDAAAPSRRRRPYLTILAGVVVTAVVLVVIATPYVFPRLSGDWQDRIVRRLPFMSMFEPTRAYQSAVLPTIAATKADALSLLATDTPQPTQGPVSTATHTPSATVASTSTVVPPSNTPSLTASRTLVPSAAATATRVPPTATLIPTTLAPSATVAPTKTDRPAGTQAEQQASTTPRPAATLTSTLTGTPTDQPTLPPTPTLTETPLPSATPAPSLTLTSTSTVTPIPPSATLVPSATLLPSPTVPPTVAPAPIPDKFHLFGLSWVPQTWNNCGPANLTQVLNYYKLNTTQDIPAAYLKPNKEDKNVSPWQILDYVDKYITPKTGLKALMRYGGSEDMIKQFIAQKFPIITETGFIDLEKPKNDQWIGHYQTVTAYDDTAGPGQFTVMDTYKGERTETYPEFDGLWEDFNRLYIVVYPKNREADVMAILGPDADETYNIHHALDLTRAALKASPNDAFAWFSLGTNFALLKQYKEAASAFDQAFSFGVLPYRMIWYQFEPFEAYYNTGHYDQVTQLVNVNLQTTQFVEETFYWQGMVAAAQGQKDKAISGFNQAIGFNPNFTPAKEALAQVRNGSFKPPVG